MRLIMEDIPRPEEWPPEGWPACPTRERYEAAVKRHQKNMKETNEPAPAAGTKSAGPDDSRFILADEIANMLSAQLIAEKRRGKQPRDLPGLFMAAAALTSENTIGAAFIREGERDEEVVASFGIIHRHPEWAGLSAGLTQVQGLEALIFWNQNHEPDAMMVLPGKLLGRNPGETPKCSAGKKAELRGLNDTLGEVFRHHGATPHHIDLCRRTQDGMGVLSGLMAGQEREDAEPKIFWGSPEPELSGPEEDMEPEGDHQ